MKTANSGMADSYPPSRLPFSPKYFFFKELGGIVHPECTFLCEAGERRNGARKKTTEQARRVR